MSKLTDMIFASKRATAAFAAAGLLLIGGGVGATRAQLKYFSDDYIGEIHTSELQVELTENEKVIEDGGELFSAIKDDFRFKTAYSNPLGVLNAGDHEEYVRVIVTKSWKNADGTKNTTLEPSLIKLDLDTTTFVPVEVSEEKTILYYPEILPLKAGVEFCKGLEIDYTLANRVTQSQEGNVITTTYVYEGATFDVHVEVQSLQTHNAAQAMKASWGLDETEIKTIFGIE